MRIGIMQPYFLPHIGYWQLIGAVDTYVIYDDVNFIRRGWVNRNRILLGGAPHLLTLPLRKASPFRKINAIEINPIPEKTRKTIIRAYSKAPFFKQGIDVFDEAMRAETQNLSAFLTHSIRTIAQALGIKPRILLSCEIEKDPALKGEEKIIHICKRLGATEYLNAIGGTALYHPDRFRREGIALKFLKPNPIAYPQFKHPFVPNLSILDALMFNPPETVSYFLKQFTLTEP